MKTALIFDPYLDTLGGGERYTLSFAKVLSDLGYQVNLAWPDSHLLAFAKDRFGIDFSDLKINKTAFYTLNQGNLLAKYRLTNKYDLVFWVSDGSLPFLFGKKNYIHFQVPFKQIPGNPLINSLKDSLVTRYIYNSIFTKQVVEPQLNLDKSLILYPPIDTKAFSVAKKQNQIISVGRFDSPSHSKRHDILIQAFSKFTLLHPEYTLVLVGGLKGDSALIEPLHKQAQGLKIKFETNPDFQRLNQLYSTSRFFWHAAGFEIDEVQHPELVEHFGMTTVEAMSAGCIPIVINKGGQKEILTVGTGRLVDTPQQMAKQTAELIKSANLEAMAQSCIQRSSLFSLQQFAAKIKKLLS